MTPTYIAPQIFARSFTCPHCHVVAQMNWAPHARPEKMGTEERVYIYIAVCEACCNGHIWHSDQPESQTSTAARRSRKEYIHNTTHAKMIWPDPQEAPPPHKDMPDDVTNIYNEARDIAGRSPRATGALLRVATEMLVNSLEPGKGTLNTKIGMLVQKGLPLRVQQAMDSLRIIGNEGGAHPGTIDLDEDESLLMNLFHLLNFVVERMISSPQKVDEIFSGLPETKLEGIRKRDDR